MVGLPLVLGDNTAVTWQCAHGGTFKINATMLAIEAGKNVLAHGDTVTPVAPCPGIPNAGIPPCQFSSGAVGTSTKKVKSPSSKGVKFTDLQIATTNGFPALPALLNSTKVFTTA